MTCSASKPVETWLPPPEQWPDFVCGHCGGRERPLYPPSDGLCSDCRPARQKPAEPTVEERLAAAGAPRKYVAFTRASWERKYGPWEKHRLFRRLLGWPDGEAPSSWLVFLFSSGYGDRKTGLGTAVLGEALARGLPGRWISQAGWLREVKATYNGGDGEREDDVWCRAANAEVLLIDDLGGTQGLSNKPWWREKMTELLHHRESHELATIVTANLADWRHVGRIHESLVSRMDVPLKLDMRSGRDYRAEERRR